jgi:hypothetical protein
MSRPSSIVIVQSNATISLQVEGAMREVGVQRVRARA